MRMRGLSILNTTSRHSGMPARGMFVKTKIGAKGLQNNRCKPFFFKLLMGTPEKRYPSLGAKKSTKPYRYSMWHGVTVCDKALRSDNQELDLTFFEAFFRKS